MASKGSRSDADKKGGTPARQTPSPRRTPDVQVPRRRRKTTLSGIALVIGVIVLACVTAPLQRLGWLGNPLHSKRPCPAWLHGLDEASRAQDAEEPLSVSSARPGVGGDELLLGVGKADITGPVVEVNMMGYADVNQLGSGLRQRLYSRAFIVASPETPEDRFVYMVLDIQSGDTAIRYGILNGLKQMGPDYAMYGHNQVAVSGTHSHSGPGAWVNYLLPQLTSKGFSKQSYQAIVDGCLLSIRRAHESLSPGTLSSGTTKIADAGINRSMFSYLANPESERARYNISAEDDGSIDQEMTLLKFRRSSDGKNIGILNWFATHGTSMLGNNTLITGDNKGVAADLFEKHVKGEEDVAEDFVAGFSQATMGDVSPNVLGAWCEDGTGKMCSFKNSTCADGRCQKCHARGPAFRDDDTGAASCFEIGRRQFAGALEIYESMNSGLEKPISTRVVKATHTFHDMSAFEFRLPNGSTARTCPASLGYSFLAGTSDGPGPFALTQHTTDISGSSPLWRLVVGGIKTPDEAQVQCQHPKPVLLNVGQAFRPYAWTPNIVDIQTFRVGDFVIVVSPGELTTMAGRRWKEAISRKSVGMFGEMAGQEPTVVIGGPSNTYAHYITTEEEYMIQRYEGASTLYGPHTLNAYIDRSLASLSFLTSDDDEAERPLHEPGPLPPDNSDVSLSFIGGVVYDGKPWFQTFGDLKTGPSEGEVFTASSGADKTVVSASFIGANPRNNLRLEQTYAAVQRRRHRGKEVEVEGEDEWETVRDDSDWGLIFHWRRLTEVFGISEVEIVWEIEDWTEPGEYRIKYYGDWKSVRGHITPFEGESASFYVQ